MADRCDHGRDQDDDPCLAERYRTGNSDAFETVFTRYRKEVFAYFYTRLYLFFHEGPLREDADDLTEEVFVQAIEKHAKFNRERGSLRQWRLC